MFCVIVTLNVLYTVWIWLSSFLLNNDNKSYQRHKGQGRAEHEYCFYRVRRSLMFINWAYVYQWAHMLVVRWFWKLIFFWLTWEELLLSRFFWHYPFIINQNPCFLPVRHLSRRLSFWDEDENYGISHNCFDWYGIRYIVSLLYATERWSQTQIH